MSHVCFGTSRRLDEIDPQPNFLGRRAEAQPVDRGGVFTFLLQDWNIILLSGTELFIVEALGKVGKIWWMS